LNFLGGTEIEIGKAKRNRLTLDLKVTRAGGRFYTPVDLEASRLKQIQIFDESKAYSQQYKEYQRIDFKTGIKLNNAKHKFSQSFYLDVQNILGVQNIFRKSYNRLTNQVNDIYQIGFFPNFIYKVEF